MKTLDVSVGKTMTEDQKDRAGLEMSEALACYLGVVSNRVLVSLVIDGDYARYDVWVDGKAPTGELLGQVNAFFSKVMLAQAQKPAYN